MTNNPKEPYAIPFDLTTEPEEPPRGAVLAYQRLGYSGVSLDYASIRAGDGLWYTTGGKADTQGVKWGDLWATIRRHAVGAVHYATAWAELDFPRPVSVVAAPRSGLDAPRSSERDYHDGSPEWTT